LKPRGEFIPCVHARPCGSRLGIRHPHAYILAQILHDWDDDNCVKILTRCREAMPTEARLLVVELVLPPGDEPFFGKWLDLALLVMVGGRERNRTEYEELLRAGGFALTGVVPTPSGASIVEAVPA
jgi:O-methyltransferase domain